MTPEQIHQELTAHYPGEKIEFVPGARLPVTDQLVGDAFIVLPVAKLVAICDTLKNVERFSFDCLSSLTAVDRLAAAENRIEVVYHLFSYSHRHAVTLKVYLSREGTPHLPTIEGVWKAANWLEREVFDPFGVDFDGHGDLRRIMLPDDWKGYPLRKDYKEEEDYHGIGTTRPPLIQ